MSKAAKAVLETLETRIDAIASIEKEYKTLTKVYKKLEKLIKEEMIERGMTVAVGNKFMVVREESQVEVLDFDRIKELLGIEVYDKCKRKTSKNSLIFHPKIKPKK